jgi:hypothetical protein
MINEYTEDPASNARDKKQRWKKLSFCSKKFIKPEKNFSVSQIIPAISGILSFIYLQL